MTERSHEARISVLEAAWKELDGEVLRLRSRTHELEAGRATVSLLLEQTKTFAVQLRDLANAQETLARRCAKEAMAELMEHREEIGQSRWGLRISWIATGIACGGFVSALVFGILK